MTKKQIIHKKTEGHCFYCNTVAEIMHIDHFISKSKWREWDLENTPNKGLLNHPENLFLACSTCNLKKSDKCPEDFVGNPFKVWSRYTRANHRVGLCLEMTVEGQF